MGAPLAWRKPQRVRQTGPTQTGPTLTGPTYALFPLLSAEIRTSHVDHAPALHIVAAELKLHSRGAEIGP